MKYAAPVLAAIAMMAAVTSAAPAPLGDRHAQTPSLVRRDLDVEKDGGHTLERRMSNAIKAFLGIAGIGTLTYGASDYFTKQQLKMQQQQQEYINRLRGQTTMTPDQVYMQQLAYYQQQVAWQQEQAYQRQKAAAEAAAAKKAKSAPAPDDDDSFEEAKEKVRNQIIASGYTAQQADKMINDQLAKEAKNSEK